MNNQVQFDMFRPTAEQQYREWRAREPEHSGLVLHEMIRLAIGDKRAGMWRSHKRLLEDIRGTALGADRGEFAIPNACMRYLAIEAMEKAPELAGWFKVGTARPRKEENKTKVIVIRGGNERKTGTDG